MKLIIIIFFSLTLSLLVISQPTQQWMQTYNGTGNNSDVLTAMVLDAAGHIYVTGYTRAGSSQAYENWGTIKFLSNSTRRWVKTYNGTLGDHDRAYGIASDNECNVYVCGYTRGYNGSFSTLEDYTTIKYDSAGNQVWVRIYNSPNNSYDIANAIIVKGNGVFVTGQSSSFSMNYSILTMRYNTNGDSIWAGIYYGGATSIGKSIAVDNSGNCVVGGQTGALSGLNYVVVKYNSSGLEQWAAVYNGIGNAADYLNAITLDESGNIYATGQSWGGGTSGYDIATVKYSAAGNLDWVARFNGFGSKDDNAYSIRYANNAVYVIGYVRQGSTSVNDDMVIIKYSLSGSIQWVQYFNSSRNYQDYAVNVDVDRNSNVYVAGYSAYNNNSGYELHTIKYNADGAELWVKNSNRTNTYADEIAVDTSLNIYAAGYGDNFPANSDYLLIKYSQGNLSANSFSRSSLNKPISDLLFTYDTLNVNLSQNNPLSTIYKIVVVIDSVLHTNDSDLEFFITHNGVTDTLIYQAGSDGDNFLNTRLDDSTLTSVQNGTAPFAGRFKPFSPLGNFIGQDPNGNWILKIYDRASGNTGILNAWHIEISYIPPIGIKTISSEIPKHFYLNQNFPNPFNPTTKIRFDIRPPLLSKEGTGVVLKVYDLLGREVASLVNEQLKPGIYEVEWQGTNFSSGVYFYQLKIETFSETKRMVLIK